MEEECNICHGERWVCEDHPGNQWKEGDGCCGGAGMLCKCVKHKHEGKKDDK